MTDQLPLIMNQRNALGPAYAAAEELLDNARALAAAMDAYSRDDRYKDIVVVESLDYLDHNIINARENLQRIYRLTHPE